MDDTLVVGRLFRWVGLAVLSAALGGGSVWSWHTGSAERLGLLWTVVAGVLAVISPAVWWTTAGRRLVMVSGPGVGTASPAMKLVLDLRGRRERQGTGAGAGSTIVAVVMELAADPERPNAWLLTVGGVRQSYVDLEDPSLLRFEYARFVGMVLDGLPAGEVDVLHVGGGALTLARYVAHTRAGSRQVVLEPDGELVELVTGRLGGVPGLEVRVCDGRSGVAECDGDSFDIVLLDAFAVDTIPAELTTAEFVEDVARVLRPGGCFVANLVDKPPLALVRRMAADTARELPHILLLGDRTVLGGRVSGHIILVACREPEPVAGVREYLVRQDDPRLRWTGGPSLQ